jgi:hypothetical protein
VLLAVFPSAIQPPITERREDRGIPKTIVLVFPELVLKGLPERGNGARIGEIRVYITKTIQDREEKEVCATSHQCRIVQVIIVPECLHLVFGFFNLVVQEVYPQENIIDYPVITFPYGTRLQSGSSASLTVIRLLPGSVPAVL